MGSKQTTGASRLKTARAELAERVHLRRLTALAEFDRCVELQRQVWEFADLDLVPTPIFVVAAHTGGQVLGAFDGEQIVGFILALAGYREGRVFLHSHMAAVLPRYQNAGVGRRLKFEQRAEALERGIRLVEWTFDPLELRNAHFNLERLGAIARHYLPNLYGQTTSPLHGSLPTDRLVAEWWIDTPRVDACVAGEKLARPANLERIRVPGKIAEWREANPLAAERAQREVREQFQHWLARGYAAVGFESDPASRDGIYLLAPYED